MVVLLGGVSTHLPGLWLQRSAELWLLQRYILGLYKGFKGILRPKALETAFSKTLLGRMQSLSTHPDLATLSDGRATEYSFLAQDWALFFGFCLDLWVFQGFCEPFFTAFRRAFQP